MGMYMDILELNSLQLGTHTFTQSRLVHV